MRRPGPPVVVRLVPLETVLRVVRVALVETVVTGVRPATADRVRPAEIETIEIGRRARR